MSVNLRTAGMSFLHRFRRNKDGAILIELAFMLPILVVLVLGAFDTARMVLLNQKLQRTSMAMADLVGQSYGLSEAELTGLFDAASYTMSPFSFNDGGTVVVSSISTEGSGTQINWVRNFGGGNDGSTFGAEGDTPMLPDGFTVREGESIIVAEAFYPYEPIFLDSLIEARNLSTYSIVRPRFAKLTSIE